jgi:hypothetical protein
MNMPCIRRVMSLLITLLHALAFAIPVQYYPCETTRSEQN